jgi:hypothetical protein
MRSKQLNLDACETDKIRHSYLDVYDAVMAPWIDKEITLLEIGVYRGGSLKLWRDYFPRGTIVGIDRKLPQHFRPGERIQIFEGSHGDKRLLSEVANKTAPDGFDIIIDDASHIDDFPDGRKFNPRTPILRRVRALLPKRLSPKIKVPFPCHS